MQGRYRGRCVKLCKGGSSETKVGVTADAVRSEGHMEIQMIEREREISICQPLLGFVLRLFSRKGESALDRGQGSI